MDLFDQAAENYYQQHAPLADRMRPRTLQTFHGQEHLFRPGSPLTLITDGKALKNLILWGPPGTGKTTLARLLATTCKAHFEPLSAVHSGKSDLVRIAKEAADRQKYEHRATLVFIDEIHRFNKAQQDGLLGPVERGVYTLVGATTENPSFECNAALLSRMEVLVLEPLNHEAVTAILRAALADNENGLGTMGLTLHASTWPLLLGESGGDARKALNLLELGALAAGGDPAKPTIIEPAHLSLGIQKRMLLYDKTGEEHYNTISAFIKSLRGSDPQAALYYLARMLEAGEDPVFIARRMVILASEDIGNADPQAAVLAESLMQTVKAIGMPEARIPLAQGAVYLSLAPKSNSAYLGIEAALKEVRASGNLPVPKQIRNAPTAFMKQQGYGKDYHYAHDYEDGSYPESLLPETLKGRNFYEPLDRGYEVNLKKRLEDLRNRIRNHPQP